MADVEERADLSASVRRGLAWGTLNSLLLRLGNLALGVILARLLAPEDFGVFAVALTVQTVLLTLADMGMSVDLVRAKHPASREPTVATVSAAISVLLALAMVSTADPVSRLMGAEDAAGTIMVLSLTLVVSGVGVVPYARLQRDFRQKQLLTCTGADFVLGTGVTIGLVLLGAGPFALGVGRVVGQTASTTLQFLLARVKPRFGFNVDVARSAVSFGLPLAAANLLSWALLSVDTVVISRIAGATALGLYVLAFNISSWPMTAIGQAIRSVSLAGFSRSEDQVGSFSTALALAWAIALPAGALLAALARPLVLFLYGSKWEASASVLGALGLFGALRVALDLVATFLLARGAARPVLYVQILWFVTLIPAVIAGAHLWGLPGAGWAHVAVAALAILPAYALALRSVGVSPTVLVRSMWVPMVAVVPSWLAAHYVVASIGTPVLALLAGGASGLAIYCLICGRWVWRITPASRKPGRRSVAPRLDQPSMGRAA